MALINCKEPGCTKTLNTTLACTDVTSLLRLNSFLSEQQESQPKTTTASHEIGGHLSFVQSKLAAYKVAPATAINAVRQLYLTCGNGHSYYYDVDCGK